MAKRKTAGKPTTPKRRAKTATTRAAARLHDIQIRTPKEVVSRIDPDNRNLPRLAMDWSFRLRNRRIGRIGRQRGGDVGDEEHPKGWEEREALETLGVLAPQLDKIAQAGVVEVEIPYESEEHDWQARIMPWESLLAAATKLKRGDNPLTVIRSLQAGGRATTIRPASTVLYVESAPCGLRSEFAFDAEEQILRLAFDKKTLVVEKDPTKAALKNRIADLKPDVVHFAGFDSHQAARLLPDLPRTDLDGYLLHLENGNPDVVMAKELAEIVCSATPKPTLVSFNIYNSAARLAGLCVAEGCGAALGYQDDFSDRLSEVFYERLYWAWQKEDEDLLAAFRYAFSEVRKRGVAATGTGVVLWCGASWLTTPTKPTTLEATLKFTEQAKKDCEQVLKPPASGSAQMVMTADVKPYAALNYSILHNSKEQSVFERFVIAKPRGKVDDVTVTVKLDLGDEEGTFEMTSALDDKNWGDTPVDLAPLITIPLISPRLRQLNDSTKTLITATVKWGPHIIYNQSHQITLLAIDEWRDDDANRVWLPSFVQPGDAAVRTIVGAAERYLVALTDDPAAGFDGYQSGKPTNVDLQVKALWTAIVQDFGLAYINPPPGGAEDSQRIRTPSAVLEARHGTCIDLALLFSACLEYVDIHPAMVLLSDHAFPGYWRRDTAQAKFEALTPNDIDLSKLSTHLKHALNLSGTRSGKRTRPWAVEKWGYPWLLQQVRSRSFVPLETVFLTAHASFDEAVEEGAANLSAPKEFDSIQDILLARAGGVTPLPIRLGGRS